MDPRRFVLIGSFGLIFSLAAHSRPLILEQVAKIPNPDPAYSFGFRAAIDGNDIVVTGSRYIEGPDPYTDLDDVIEWTAFLFTHGGNGQWNFVTRLHTTQQAAYFAQPMEVGIKNGVIGIASGSGPLAVFERTTAGWVRAQSTGEGDATTDVEVESGAIILSVGAGTFGARVFRKNTSGIWGPVSTVWGPYRAPDDAQSAGDVDLSSNRLIVGGYDENNVRGEAHIFSGAPSSYVRTAILKNPFGNPSFADHVALEGNTAVATGSHTAPAAYVFQNNGGVWDKGLALQPIDAFTRGNLYPVDISGGIVAVGYPWDTAGRGSVCIFERDTNGVFQQTATLVLTDEPDGYGRAFSVKVSGRRVVVQALNAVYVYQLPTNTSQPDSVQDDFEDGNAAGWTPVPGSSFSVVSSGTTQIYRQSSLGSSAGATLAQDLTNQSIQADVKPTAFAGADHWFGLTVRNIDQNNHYYVTLRNSNVIQIKKMVNGSYQTLASAPFNMQLSRTYRVQLEAVGTAIRAHVDGQLMVQARDSTLTHGRAGILMYRARVDHDNIVVTPGPRTHLFADDFQQGSTHRWTSEGEAAWTIVTEDWQQTMQQNSLVGGARAVTGVSTEDQIIEARAKVLSFASGGERWFGLMARYVDEGNYYYLTVRNNNVVSLRKLVNGVINVLDNAPLTVTPNTWYTLRLEAVANGIRAYVNGALMLEANELNPIPRGRYGAVMYKAVAAYDDVSVYQP